MNAARKPPERARSKTIFYWYVVLGDGVGVVLSVVVIGWLVGSDRVLIGVGWLCQSINIKEETIFWDTQYL